MVALSNQTPAYIKQTPQELRFALLFCTALGLLCLHNLQQVSSGFAAMLYAVGFMSFLLGGAVNAMWLYQSSMTATSTVRLAYRTDQGPRD